MLRPSCRINTFETVYGHFLTNKSTLKIILKSKRRIGYNSAQKKKTVKTNQMRGSFYLRSKTGSVNSECLVEKQQWYVLFCFF